MGDAEPSGFGTLGSVCSVCSAARGGSSGRLASIFAVDGDRKSEDESVMLWRSLQFRRCNAEKYDPHIAVRYEFRV